MESKRLLNHTGQDSETNSGALPKSSLTEKKGFFAKYKWWLAGLGVLIIIAIILGCTLGKGDDPVPPGPGPDPVPPVPTPIEPGYNPYTVTASVNDDNTVSGIIVASVEEIERQAHLHPLAEGDDPKPNLIKASPKIVPNGVNNKIVKNVAFEFGQSDQTVAYLRLSDANASGFSIPTSQVNKPGVDQTMKLNSLGFQLHEGKFGFDFRSFRNKQTYITTNDCAFVMMDKYFQMDMVLPSRRIYGLGERNRNFTLDEGTYTMWARHEPVTQVDDGTTGEGNSNGVHPFVLVQTETKGEFLGLFFRNSDLMSPIVRYTANNTATLSIISIGGNVEIYFLFKGNARNIIAQYQNLVGKPAMPPAWALGWQTQGNWNQTQIEGLVTALGANNLPVEVLQVANIVNKEKNFQINMNAFPDPQGLAATLKTAGLKLVPTVNQRVISSDPTDTYYSAALQADALIQSTINSKLEGGALTNSDAISNKIVFPDFLGNEAQGLWTQGLDALQKEMPFDGVFIDQNSGPYGYCFGECPNGLADQAKSPKDTPNDDILEAGWWQGFNDQSSNSTYNLPFIPGNYATSDNLDYYTASLNGTHPGDNSNEYDVHSLYGHASGKATYNAIRQSTNATLQDKLPYVTSRGSFAGSGQYMGHTFSVINRPGRMKNEVELMRYRIANIMNFNMFGMPMSGPDVISDIIADKETKVNYTASYIQFNAFTPLAQVFDAELFVDPAYAAQAALVKAAMNERLSFIHLFHTCMFEAHDQGNTCYDPLFYFFPENDYLYNNTEGAVMVADTILVTPNYNYSAETFEVYYPNQGNGSWVNLRNFTATTVDPSMEGQNFTAPGGNVDVVLRPGKMIPWVSNADGAYKTVQEVLHSSEVQLVINRDGNGHALTSMYIGDGITQSQLDAKTYEFYYLNFGNKSLKKIVANENRVNSGKKLQSILIVDAADVSDTDFACMTDENDLSITQLDIAYNADLKILNISHANGIPMWNMKDVHFGKTGQDLNLCNLESHFYHLGTVDKQVDQWTVQLISDTPDVAHELELKISQFKNNVINLQWNEKDHGEDYFKVPDEALAFNRSDRVNIDVSLLELAADVNNHARVIVKNAAGDNLYALNGGILTHDHFNYFDIDIMSNGNLIGLADQVGDSLFLQDGVHSLWTKDTEPAPVNDGKLPGKNANAVQPFLMSVSTTSPSVGLFSNTAAAQDWWIKKNTVNALFNIKVFAAGGIGDHFIFVGGDQTTPAPLQIVKSYNVLFGQPLAPPQWAFGWHQSRWGYNSTDKLREVIAMYKAEELPLDAIWSDVDYMDDYQTFTIGTKHGFADLAEFVEGLHNESLHYVPVIDASIAITPLGDTPYDLSQYLGCLVQGTDGKDFVGRVSANDAVWHDWFHPQGNHLWRGYLQDLYEHVMYDGIWLIMNEAVNFCNGACYSEQDSAKPAQDKLKYLPTQQDLSGNALSLEATHYNGFTEMDTHSLFGHMSAYASSTWFELNQNNRRKMIIESSAYTGTSRFASRWLGDYISNADYMGYSVTGIMLQSMNGFSMSGPDVCGFFGDATGELCARWYTVAAFQPFARNHNTYNTAAQEPYVFDKEIYDSTITYMDIIKHSMQTRLNMIRYMYSSTILDMHFGNEVYYQPLFFQFPADAKAYSASQQNNVMLGKHMKLSVLSNMVDQNTTSFYFPAGTWCNMFQNVGNQACFTSTGEDKTLPTKAYNYYVHLKENSIVPMQNVTFLKELYPAVAFTSTTDMQSQAVEFHIHPNASGNATGNYYNDDGETETGNVGTFNVYSLDLYLSQVDGSVTFNVTTIHEATNYPNSAVNENDVLGQVHIYNAEGLGLNKNWQSEVHYKTGEVVSLLIAEYQPYVDRVVLPPMYLYLPSIDFIKFIPIV